jgi:hypothetical protein
MCFGTKDVRFMTMNTPKTAQTNVEKILCAGLYVVMNTLKQKDRAGHDDSASEQSDG